MFGYKWCWVVGLVRVNKKVRESLIREKEVREKILKYWNRKPYIFT